ncbi:MAG: hypothetical protein AB7R40_26360 [Nitrospiraceae bacterium]
METTPIFSYQFRTYEPAVLVEIYLPKKAEYQGALYTTLTDAFNFTNVKHHLADPLHRAHILQLLQYYPRLHMYDAHTMEASMAQVEPIRWGYSVYEVDGVFFDYEREAKLRQALPRELTDEEVHSLLYEERTQVVKMIFRPHLHALLGEVESQEEFQQMRAIAVQALASPSQGEALAAHTGNLRHQAIIKAINKWIDDVAFFLYGYIIFHICRRLEELQKAKKIHLEEEIWVTSLWNLQLNRTIKIAPSPPEADRG